MKSGAIHRGSQSVLGSCVAVGSVLKPSVLALGEAQRLQSLREIKDRFHCQSKETRNLRCTPEQWREVQRRNLGTSA